MQDSVFILVISRHIAAAVDVCGGRIETVRRIEAGKGAVPVTNEAVRYIIGHVISRYVSAGVDAMDHGTGCAGGIELHDGAILVANKSVPHALWLREVVSGDFSGLIDALRRRAQTRSLARAGHIEGGESPVPVPHKTVHRAYLIFVVSGDLAGFVHVLRAGPLPGISSGARDIERGECAGNGGRARRRLQQ